jgi:hypothetical protein
MRGDECLALDRAVAQQQTGWMKELKFFKHLTNSIYLSPTASADI